MLWTSSEIILASLLFLAVLCGSRVGATEPEIKLPKLSQQETFEHKGHKFTLLHYGKGPVLSKQEFDVYHFSRLADIFNKCYAFNLERDYTDYEILSKFLQGPVFEDFVLVEEVPDAEGTVKRKTCATLTLSYRKIDPKNDAVHIYNMCISPELQGIGLGKVFMRNAFQMLYRKLGLKPSRENPMLLALTLLVHSPTFMAACKMYHSQGFYRYSFGNIAYQHNDEVLSIIKDLKTLGSDSKQTVLNSDIQRDWNEWRKVERFKRTPLGKNQDLAVSLYRLDYYGDGVTTDFSLPPTDFCPAVQTFMNEKYQNGMMLDNLDSNYKVQPKSNDSDFDDYSEDDFDYRDYL